MKDDVTPPNLGQAPTQYDQPFMFRALNELEKFARLFLSKGPIRVSDLTADSITLGGSSIHAGGDWLVFPSFGGGSASMAGSSVGRYQKVGSVITAWGDVTFTNKGVSTGVALFDGLPEAASGVVGSVVFGFVTNMAGLNSEVFGLVSGTTIIPFHLNSNTGAGTAGVQLTDANFTNTSRLVFAASYWTGA